MSTRYIAYANAGASSQSFNALQQNVMVADGDIFQALNLNGNFWGLAVTPGTGLSINIGVGGITSYQQIDPAGVAGYLVNTAYAVKKASTSSVTNLATFTSPATGQATNYLLEATFVTTPGNAAYINYKTQAANGVVTSYTGGSQLNTTITDSVSFTLKAGAPANVGTQVTPGVDNGSIPIAVITILGGATSISSGNISVPANAPTVESALASLLSLSSYLTAAQAAGQYVPTSQLATGAVASSVAQRAADGSLTATAFHGVADSAATAANATYAANAGVAANCNQASFSTIASTANNALQLAGMSVTNNAAPNSIPQLDGSGNLNVNQLNGTATQALNAQTLQNYGPSVTASAGTVAVRDGSGNLSANTFNGTAVSADFADFAERFGASEPMEAGDLVQFGGAKDIMLATADTGVFGVVSTAPGYLCNGTAGDDASHPPVAFVGRVPVKIMGACAKGDWLIPSTSPGVALACSDPKVREAAVGRALEPRAGSGVGKVMAFVRTVI